MLPETLSDTFGLYAGTDAPVTGRLYVPPYRDTEWLPDDICFPVLTDVLPPKDEPVTASYLAEEVLFTLLMDLPVLSDTGLLDTDAEDEAVATGLDVLPDTLALTCLSVVGTAGLSEPPEVPGRGFLTLPDEAVDEAAEPPRMPYPVELRLP